MHIEITPKIAAWLEIAMKGSGPSSPAKAIESLIDAAIDPETGIPLVELRSAIQAGIESGMLAGDAQQAVIDIFAAARQRHNI